MKRLLALLTALLLCLSAVACGGKPADTPESSGASLPEPSAPEQSESLPSPTDTTDAATTAGTTAARTTVSGGKTSPTKSAGGGTSPTETPVVHATLPKFNIRGKTVELLTHDSPETEESKKIIARFKDAYGATLKMTSVSWSDMATKLNSRVMSNDPPDAVVVRNADIYTYQLNGILKDISGMLDLDSVLWRDIKARNSDLMLGDKQYVAVIQNWVSWYLWYNKTLMRNNGVTDTPDKLYERGEWTVSAMQRLAKELTLRDGEAVTQYGLGANYDTLANCLMAARGTALVTRDGSTFKNNITATQMADAYNLLFDLYAADKCMAPIDQHSNMFAKGRCAMLVEGSWLTDQRSMRALKDKGSIELVPFPKWDGEPERQMGEMTCTGIPRNAKNTDLGLAYINFQRYSAIDYDQRKLDREQQKKTRLLTDSELDRMAQVEKYAVPASGLGIPNTQQYMISMMVAYGNAWSLAVEKYAPEVQKAVDELNASAKG